MLCQNCGKNTATTHIQTIVNGKLTQAHLCEDCAREKGYANLFESWGFGNLLGGLMGSGAGKPEVQRCPSCHSSFEEIAKTGKIGCAQCYQTFRSQLLPVIQRIHGTARHKGKIPGSSALRIVNEDHEIMPVAEKSALEEKKELLKRAVEVQDFEQAAKLRDEIKEMEQHG